MQIVVRDTICHNMDQWKGGLCHIGSQFFISLIVNTAAHKECDNKDHYTDSQLTNELFHK